MRPSVQLTLFGQQPQFIRYDTNNQRVDQIPEKVSLDVAQSGVAPTPVTGPGYAQLVNASGEVLYAGRGTQRVLLERALAHGNNLSGLHALKANFKHAQLLGPRRLDLTGSN